MKRGGHSSQPKDHCIGSSGGCWGAYLQLSRPECILSMPLSHAVFLFLLKEWTSMLGVRLSFSISSFALEQFLVCWGCKLFTSNHIRIFLSIILPLSFRKEQRKLLLPSPKQSDKGPDVIMHIPKYLSSSFHIPLLVFPSKKKCSLATILWLMACCKWAWQMQVRCCGMWDEWSSVVEIPSLHCAQPPWDASGGVNGHRESLDLGRGRCLEVRLLPLHSYEPFPGVG